MAYVKDSDLMNYLVYFDQKQTTWFSNNYVAKKDGMSLISDTTVTAITNHLNNVDDFDTVPGGSGGGDSTVPAYDFNAALDEYFATKTATLNGGGA